MLKIPRYEQRLKAMHFKMRFHEKMKDVDEVTGGNINNAANNYRSFALDDSTSDRSK